MKICFLQLRRGELELMTEYLACYITTFACFSVRTSTPISMQSVTFAWAAKWFIFHCGIARTVCIARDGKSDWIPRFGGCTHRVRRRQASKMP